MEEESCCNWSLIVTFRWKNAELATRLKQVQPPTMYLELLYKRHADMRPSWVDNAAKEGV